VQVDHDVEPRLSSEPVDAAQVDEDVVCGPGIVAKEAEGFHEAAGREADREVATVIRDLLDKIRVSLAKRLYRGFGFGVSGRIARHEG